MNAPKKKDINSDGKQLISRNPKAFHRYEIEDRWEAGLMLMGSEVKSLRAGRADLEGAYAGFQKGELFLHKMHIAPYEAANAFGHEPKRTRKLLMHARELSKLQDKLTLRGYTLLPLALYFRRGIAKVELGLGKGRKEHDKRHEIKRNLDLKDARNAMRRQKGR